MKSSIYWIEGPWKGRLAIVPRPRGGDWLEDEAAAWKQQGVNTVVSTLTDDEIEDFDLHRESAASEQHGVEFLAYPIPDRGVPASMKAASALLGGLEKKLSNGKNIVIHCRQGIGRSAVLAASLLILAGLDVDTAVQRVAAARGCPVPETQEQRDWVRRFAKELSFPARSVSREA